MSGPLRIEVAGETNVGMKRTHNEDNFSILEESGLYIVADGMGGHASGEVAAKMAVDSLKEFFAATANDPTSFDRRRCAEVGRPGQDVAGRALPTAMVSTRQSRKNRGWS